MESIRYFETNSTDPYYNLAFEETVLRLCTEGDILLLWQNDNTVVIGQNQNAEAEINRTFVEAHDIKVVRRMTGGGAVYHDLGNLNYSFITDAGDPEKLTMSRFTDIVVRALRGMGLNAEASGRNDILVSGKKVSGTAQRLMGKRILHHGTLLFDSDPEMVAGALNADPSKFISKSSKSVKSRIGNIRELLPFDMTLSDFWESIKNELTAGGCQRQELDPQQSAEADRLCREKYSTWEWNFGRSPQYDMTNRRRFSGGSLETGVSVAGGRITGIAFRGDFLSISPVKPLEEALQGCPFRADDVAQVIDRFPIGELFGGIARQEILDTLFHAGDMLA